MLAYNYYHLNIILKSYKIEDIILKNDSKMEKHSVEYKTQDLQFIILPKYNALKSTIITIPCH